MTPSLFESGGYLDLMEEEGFVDGVWLSQHGPLTSDNVLEYFSRSTHYERTCNNEYIRNEELNPSVLLTLQGIEYRVEESDHPMLFVIVKQYRHSRTVVRNMDFFFVFDNRVFQAHTVSELVASRLSRCCKHLQNVLDIIWSFKSPIQPVIDPPPRLIVDGAVTQEDVKINTILKGLLQEFVREIAGQDDHKLRSIASPRLSITPRQPSGIPFLKE